MSGIIVSVIVPFLESNNKLIDTLSSISEQKNINQENIEVLIVDATDKTSGKIESNRQIYHGVQLRRHFQR